MEDPEIVALYWARDQRAIPETAEKYGNYCLSVAGKLLESREDAEECVNDAWLRAWNAMPPHRPQALAAFLGKITRNLAINRRRRESAEKRGGGQAEAVFEELAGVVSGGDSVERESDRRELLRAINGFLETLPPEKRVLFVRRYWYFDSVAEIAERMGRTENQVSATLSRLRRKLREHLLEGGFTL